MKIQLISVFALLATLGPCSAHVGGQTALQDVEDADYHFYCGSNLAKFLAALCYENDNPVKRAYGREIKYNPVLGPYHKERNNIAWMMLAPHRAQGLEVPSRGKRVGIAAECCDKPCTLDELLSYC